MTNLASKIAAQNSNSTVALDRVRAEAAKLASTPTSVSSSDWAAYTNRLAVAEGKATAWFRITCLVDYCERTGEELTMARVMEVALDLVSVGADDTGSGRTNDASRARFDGIRAAVADLKYL